MNSMSSLQAIYCQTIAKSAGEELQNLYISMQNMSPTSEAIHLVIYPILTIAVLLNGAEENHN